jgi:hypothetical protein
LVSFLDHKNPRTRYISVVSEFENASDEFEKIRLKFYRSIICRRNSQEIISRSYLITMLKDHIFNNVIFANSTFYHQTVGIPQGSILSALLCCLYLASAESKYIWPNIIQENSVSSSLDLMVRQIDDYLFISEDKNHATAFAKIMSKGIQEYNIRINPSKAKSSFGLENFSLFEKEFPWCGLLIDTETLEIRSDYSKYTHTMIRNSIKVHVSSNPGKTLLQKRLKYFILPKINLALLDSSVNSRETVISNVRLIFFSSCLKLIIYASAMPEFPHTKLLIRALNSLWLKFCITNASKFRKSERKECHFPLTDMETKFLAWNAYLLCTKMCLKDMRNENLFSELGRKGKRRSRARFIVHQVWQKCLYLLKSKQFSRIKIPLYLEEIKEFSAEY